MRTISRRTFLGSAALGGATLVVPGCSGAGAARGYAANETIAIGVVGLRGRGNDLLQAFRKVPNVRIVALCDVDPAVLGKRAEEATKLGETPTLHRDARALCAERGIDAVAVATPNHTHASVSLHALAAGKHVYVEKPVSHDLHEGQVLLAVAREQRAIVQAGTQNRSDVALVGAFGALHRGELGALRSLHGICYRDRKGIGRRASPLAPPPGLDYDLWLGPAADLPILRESFHYDWHWVWNTGNGDIGNQGPHELDMLLWALGDPGLPHEIVAGGARLGWNDAGETPNLMLAAFRFERAVPVTFEVRNLVPRSRTGFHGLAETGVVAVTAHGELRAQRGSAVFCDPEGKVVRAWKGDHGATHVANFVAALRAGDAATLRAELALGHRSAALAHLANASYRLGTGGSLADLARAGNACPGWEEHLASVRTNLQGHGLADASVLVGARLAFDPRSERCHGEHAAAATALLRPQRRKGHELPARQPVPF